MAHPNENSPARLARFAATLLVLTLVAGGLAAVALATEPFGRIDGEKVPPVLVSVAPAEARSGYVVARTFVGVVEARRETLIGFELPGEIAAILAEEGDFVQQGEVVAELDTAILAAERRRLVAARDQARARLELAEITRQRVARALQRNAVSSQEWDRADKDYRVGAAALAGAEAAIAAIDTKLAKARLKSPYRALVARRLVDEGQVLPAGSPVLQLLERVEPEVRIGVAGDAIDAVSVGDRLDVTIRGRAVPATVKAVLPLRGSRTRSVDVILTLHAQFDGIRRGDLATLEIARTKRERGFWLPLSALAPSSRGLWACYVAERLEESQRRSTATHRIRRRELEVVQPETDRVFVRGTLEPGELVAIEGLHRLVPDQLVRLAPQDPVSTRGASR